MVAGSRPALVPPGDLDIEALLKRACRVFAEVPLAEMAGGVAVFFQGLGEGELFERKTLVDLSVQEPLEAEVPPSRQPVGQVEARRVLAAQDAGAGGGSERRRGISFGKAHSALCEAVDVWRFVEGRPVATTVTPARMKMMLGEAGESPTACDAQIARRTRTRSEVMASFHLKAVGA